MRWALVALATVAATLGAAAVIVACSSDPECTPGKLDLRLGLLGGATEADTIAVDGDDPGAVVTLRTPHAVDPAAVAVGIDHVTVEVTFPGGYPKHALVHLLVRAFENGTIVGINKATIQLGDTCGVGTLLVPIDSGVPLDAGSF